MTVPVLALLLLVGCQTETEVTYGPAVQAITPDAPPDALEDATAPLIAQPGSRYPALYDSESFAVFLGPTTLIDRLEADAAIYRYPADQMEAERNRIHTLASQFIICELHLVSRFGDPGIAHDAVSLRTIHATLTDDTGRSAAAAAAQASGIDELEMPDMTMVKRVVLVFFPRIPAPGQPPLIQPSTQRVRLLLTGEQSAFTAEWDVSGGFRP